MKSGILLPKPKVLIFGKMWLKMFIKIIYRHIQ